MREMIVATYRLGGGSKDGLEQKAEQIALGQTVGAWTPMRDAHPELWARHRGEVVGVERPSDSGAGLVRIAFPTANCEPDLPSLLTMVFGKVSLDGQIKLLDLEFPPAWLTRFPGPKFGVAGLRQRLGVADAPLTMAIFKPCIGLSAEQLGAMFYELAAGGLDLMKDDEILPDLPTAPTERRLEQCLAAAARATQETGRTVLYAINLTGPVDTLRERARRLQSLGATCFLFNVLSYGWGALETLARDPELTTPILAHPALSGGLCGSPDYGMSYALVLGKLMRLAGADLVLYPAHYGTFPFPAEEEFAIRDALRDPWAGRLAAAWPGPSVGIHPGMVPRLLADYGRDVVINAGGGVHGHPQGAGAGARALRQAVDLALAGRPFHEPLPSGHPELEAAIAHWGMK